MDRVLRILTPALLAVVLVLLGVVIAQMNTLEERFIVQGRQLRALGEATDKILAGGVQVAAKQDDVPPDVKLLHPEVENFLVEKETRWPPKGASMDGTLVYGWPTGNPKGFNPLLENASEFFDQIVSYAGSYLARRNEWTDPEGFYGDLAWRVEVTDDFKEFTIYLRKGVKWHAPPNLDLDSERYRWLAGDHEFTAHDLVFTWDLLRDPQVQNGHFKNYFKELKSHEAIGDYTFVVRWKKSQYTNSSATLFLLSPVPRFLYGYDENGRPFPKETLGTQFNQHWYNNKGYIGTGAYRMASYEPGTRIRLLRNEDYFGDRPAIREVVYPIYSDAEQTLLKLKAHEINFGFLMPAQYREEIYRYAGAAKRPTNSPFFDGRIRCHTVTLPVYRYIGWNADKPMFADKRVRKAMTHALNRQEILDKIFSGLGDIATGPLLPSTPYADPGIQPLPFDLTAAKRLLTEAGWSDSDGDGVLDKKLKPTDARASPFRFTFLITSSVKEYTSMANVFREDLLKIGVKMSFEAVEWSVMQKRMGERKFDAFVGAWMLPWDTDLYQTWHSSQADTPKGSNMIGFRNKEADDIIEKLRNTFDLQERIRLAHRFHRIVHEEQPYTFFSYAKRPYCAWNEVKNVTFAKYRPVDNFFPWWVEETH